MNPFLIRISECFPKILTLYDGFYITLFALLTMLGGKKGELFDFVGEVIRVVTKVDGVGLTTALAKPVLIPHLGSTFMDSPQLGAAVRAVLCPGLGVRSLA